MSSRPRVLLLRFGACAIVLALLAAPLLIQPAGASHAWNNYHWPRRANPVPLQLLDSVTAAYDPLLATARTDWDKSAALKLTIVPSNSSPTMRNRCWLEWNAIRACNANYGDTGWGGLAMIQIDGSGHITAAAAAVNDFYLTGLPATQQKQWRLLTLCQEVGHAFGLDHQDENQTNPNLNTCMDYTNNPASNQHPNAHDYAQLTKIYTHSHDPGSIAQVQDRGKTGARIPNVKREVKDGPTAQAKRGSGPTVIKEKLPNGQTLITYIDWAPPELVAAAQKAGQATGASIPNVEEAQAKDGRKARAKDGR